MSRFHFWHPPTPKVASKLPYGSLGISQSSLAFMIENRKTPELSPGGIVTSLPFVLQKRHCDSCNGIFARVPAFQKLSLFSSFGLATIMESQNKSWKVRPKSSSPTSCTMQEIHNYIFHTPQMTPTPCLVLSLLITGNVGTGACGGQDLRTGEISM